MRGPAAGLARQGSLDEALALEEQAAGLAHTLGQQHPDTLRCRASLLLTRHQQAAAGAAAERQEVIQQLAELLGSEHPDLATLVSGGGLLRVIDPQPF